MAHLTIESFGYDHGDPPDTAVWVRDVRDIPTSVLEGLWQLDGTDQAVQDAVMGTVAAQRAERAFLANLSDWSSGDLVAFGCAEGIHRSVALAEVCAVKAREAGWDVTVRNRDLALRDTTNRMETMNRSTTATAPKDRAWWEIRDAAADTAEVWIYSEIGDSFWGDSVTAKQLVTDLAKVTAPNIHLRINSPGGSVFDAQAIHNALRRHPATVTSFIDGLAASAASFIALAGEKVVMAENALFMIHEPWGGASGTAQDMRDMADVLDKVKDSILGHYVAKTGQDAQALSDAMTAETWYTAEEALAAGFIDEIGTGVNVGNHFDAKQLQNRYGYRRIPAGIENAGRVLSQKNIDKITQARDHLAEVLADATDQTSDSTGAAETVTGGAPDPSTTPTPTVVEAFVPGVGFTKFRKD